LDSDYHLDEDTARKLRFEQMVERYHRSIIHFMARMTGNSEIAVDLAQEVFVKSYKNFYRYDGRTELSTWLFAIASNHARDFLRRRSVQKKAFDQLEMQEQLRQCESPDTSASRAETGFYLEEALKSLPLEWREPIILRHLHHLSLREISQILQIPPTTVKMRLFRGRQVLQEKLIQWQVYEM
jgi:RNA polymerase sigma-70 factor, ECF subfamily